MKAITNTVLENLAQSYKTSAVLLTYFNGGYEWSDGILYTFPLEGKTRILKVMEFPVEKSGDARVALSARLDFVRFLGERGVPIVFPEPTQDGKLYSECVEDDRLYIAYSYDKREGIPIYEAPFENRPALFEQWGEAMGKMHATAEQYPYWNQIPEDPEGRLLGWEQELNSFHSWCKDEEVKAAWRQLKEKLEVLPVERSGFGFTHNDLHISNLITQEGKVTVLDFDVSNPHWFACDLATALYSLITHAAHGKLEHPPEDAEMLKQSVHSFLTGYSRIRPQASFPPEQIELFLHYRRLLLFTVMYDEMVRSNPDHLAVWRQRILEQAPFPDLGL
ncbi:phosphotransferase [Gorillibacterium sp. CAU 1737]|uniref:phosphotransferase enzyme family protein n=1 Tax=Gorillibacterium sp. CAU 1737 TaxID=3140362 RepID=UPI0032619FCC